MALHLKNALLLVSSQQKLELLAMTTLSLKPLLMFYYYSGNFVTRAKKRWFR